MPHARFAEFPKKFLKNAIRTAKRLACYAILLEGAVAGVSIYEEIKFPQKERSFSNNHFFSNSSFVLQRGKLVLEHPLQMCASMYYSIPCFANYHLGIGQNIGDKLEAAVQHEKTLKGIESLFVKDDKIDYAEIGGLLFLNSDGQNRPYLEFYDIPSKNESLCEMLIREGHDSEKKLSYFKDDKFHHQIWIDIPDIDELLQKAETTDGNYKKRVEEAITDIFMSYSDCLYYLSEESIANFFYSKFGGLNGKFLGAFHTHNMAVPPSDMDFKASRLLRGFVVVRYSDSYMLYDLYKGNAKAVYTIPRHLEEQ